MKAFIKLFFILFFIDFLIAQNLLFKSSFDDIIVDKTVSWNHHLNGTDSITNFTFPDDLPGDNLGHFFNYVVGDMDNYFNYANADVLSTIGYDGNPTNALYIEFLEDDPNYTSYSRVQYVMYGDDASGNLVQRMNQGYVKYRIKTHLDHSDTLSDWRLPIEWKDMDDDGFRMGLYIYDTDTTSPYWVVKGQYMINGSLGNDVWQFDNYTIPVIEDDWFEIEVFWLGNPNSNLGKLKVAINGQLLFDVTNQTKDPNKPNKMFYFMPFKVYGTIGNSWITDFEYWDSPPTNSILNDNALNAENDVKYSIEKVYPNPTNNLINVSENCLGNKYQIINTSGIIVKKGIAKNKTINVSLLEKGIYLLKISDKLGNSYTEKLIIN